MGNKETKEKNTTISDLLSIFEGKAYNEITDDIRFVLKNLYLFLKGIFRNIISRF